MLEAHCDTLGAMVHEIKTNGHLKLTNIGGMQPNNAEAENVRIITKSGRIARGNLSAYQSFRTCQRRLSDHAKDLGQRGGHCG